MMTAERTKLTEPCLNGWLQPPQNSCWHWVHLKCKQPPLTRKKRNLHFGQSERSKKNVTTWESSKKTLWTKNLQEEFLFYRFCSCWEAAPALSFGIRGCWVAPTLWTSGMRFLHAVEPTRQQTPRSTASINMRLQGLAQCRGSTVRIVYLSGQHSQRPKFYFYV